MARYQLSVAERAPGSASLCAASSTRRFGTRGSNATPSLRAPSARPPRENHRRVERSGRSRGGGLVWDRLYGTLEGRSGEASRIWKDCAPTASASQGHRAQDGLDNIQPPRAVWHHGNSHAGRKRRHGIRPRPKLPDYPATSWSTPASRAAARRQRRSRDRTRARRK